MNATKVAPTLATLIPSYPPPRPILVLWCVKTSINVGSTGNFDRQRRRHKQYDDTVRLWDAGTGAQLQKLDLGITTRTLLFSTSGQYLKTDRGVLYISSLKSFTSSSEQVHPLFVSDDWVIEDDKIILWLPPDYRATCVANWNGMVVLGHSSGGVSFLEFEKGLKAV